MKPDVITACLQSCSVIVVPLLPAFFKTLKHNFALIVLRKKKEKNTCLTFDSAWCEVNPVFGKGYVFMAAAGKYEAFAPEDTSVEAM